MDIKLYKNKIIELFKSYGKFQFFVWKHHKKRADYIAQCIDKEDNIERISKIIDNELGLFYIINDNMQHYENKNMNSKYYESRYSKALKNKGSISKSRYYQSVLLPSKDIILKAIKDEADEEVRELLRSKQQFHLTQEDDNNTWNIIKFDSQNSWHTIELEPKYITDADFILRRSIADSKNLSKENRLYLYYRKLYIAIMSKKLQLPDETQLYKLFTYFRFLLVEDKEMAWSLMTDVISTLNGDKKYSDRMHKALAAIDKAYSDLQNIKVKPMYQEILKDVIKNEKMKKINKLEIQKQFRIIMDELLGTTGHYFFGLENFANQFIIFYYHNMLENKSEIKDNILKDKLYILYIIIKITLSHYNMEIKNILLNTIKKYLKNKDREMLNTFFEDTNLPSMLENYRQFNNLTMGIVKRNYQVFTSICKNPINIKTADVLDAKDFLASININIPERYYYYEKLILQLGQNNNISLYCASFSFPILHLCQSVRHTNKFSKISYEHISNDIKDEISNLIRDYFFFKDDELKEKYINHKLKETTRFYLSSPLLFTKNKNIMISSYSLSNLYEKTYEILLDIHDTIDIKYRSAIHTFDFSSILYELDKVNKDNNIFYGLSMYIKTDIGNVYYIKNMILVDPITGYINEKLTAIIYGIILCQDENFEVFKYKNNKATKQASFTVDDLIVVNQNFYRAI